MKLKLNNFKCYVEATFDLPDTGLVLLNGCSGAGKTTLISALMFVLYGNVRKVANFLYPNKQTSVELDFPRLSINIYRQKKPDLLRVKYKDTESEDQEAQAIIDRIFGNEVLFDNGSYVKQKKGCTLLEGTNTERMDHIAHFAFEHDTSMTPMQLKDSIQKHITSKDRELSVEQALFSNCQTETLEAEKAIEGTEPPPLADEITTLKSTIEADYQTKQSEYNKLNETISNMVESRATLDSLESFRVELVDRLASLEQSLIKPPSDDELKQAKLDSARDSSCFSAMQSFLDLNEEYKNLEANIAHVDKPSKSQKDAEATIVNTNIEYKQAQLQYKQLSQEFIKSGEANAKLVTLKDHISSTQNEIADETKVVDSINITESDITRTIQTIQSLEYKINLHQEFQLNQDRKSILLKQRAELDCYKDSNLMALQIQIDVHKQLNARGVKESVEKLDHAFQKSWTQYHESLGDLLRCPSCFQDVLYRDEELHLCKHQPNPNKKPGTPIKIKVPIEKADWVKGFRLVEDTLKADPKNKGLKDALVILKKWIDDCNQLLAKKKPGTTLESLAEDINNINMYQELSAKISAQPKIEQPKELLVDLKRAHKIETESLETFREQKATIDAAKKRLISLKSRLAAYEREAASLASLRHPDKVKQELTDTQTNITKLQKILDENTQLVDFWHKYNTFVSQQKIIIDLKKKIQTHITTLKKYERDSWTLDALSEAMENSQNKLTELTVMAERAIATRREYDSAQQQLDNINMKIEAVNFDDALYQEKKSEYIVRAGELKILHEKLEHTQKLYSLRTLYDQLDTRRAAEEAKLISINRCNSELATLVKLKDLAIKAESQVLLETVQNINRIMEAELKGLFDQDIKVTLDTVKHLKTKDAKKFQLNCNINYKGFNYDDISSLSGGEGDRVSLAMVSALNRISGSHFLILDETIGSMDSELKLDVLDALRALGNTRLILIVNHEGVLGAFDCVVDVFSQ